MARVQRQRQSEARLALGLVAGYRQAGDLFQAASEAQQAVIARKEGCGVLLGLGRLAPAASCYQEMLVRVAGDAEEESAILNLLGLTREQQGELRAARAAFDRALAVARLHHDLDGEGSALNNLALLDREQGQQYQAIARLEAALEIWRALGRRSDEAATLHNLGSIHTELGHFDEALDLLRDALAIRRQRGRPDLIAGTLVEVGWAYHLAGRPERAAAYFRESIRLYRAIGQPLGEAAALDRLGSVLCRSGQSGPASAAYRRALALAERGGDLLSVAHTRANLGWLLLEQGLPAEAVQELSPALDTFRRLGEPDGRAHVLVGLAAAAQQQGDLAAARQRLDEALGLVEQIRASGRRRGHWIQSISLWRDYYERYVELLVDLHRRDRALGTLPLAFELSDWARSRNLHDMLLESQLDLRSGIAPRLRAAEAGVQQRLNAVDEMRHDLPPGAGGRAAFDRSLRDLLLEYHQVEATIRAAHLRHAAVSRPSRVRLAAVQRLLDRETRLISYVLGERRSFVFVVGPTSLEVRELPPRGRIEAMAQTVYQGLAHSDQMRARHQAQLAAASLSAVLLGPVHLPPEVRKLLVATDGALLYIPFAALPQPGATDTGGEPPLLIDRYEIVHLPSAATLVTLRLREARRRKLPAGELAVVADPVFSQADPRLPIPRAGATQAASAVADLSPLPFTRREADAIAGYVPADRRLLALGFAAHRDLVLSGALANYRILHFATHALIDEVHPELSGLVLSAFDEQGRPRQAQLRLHEIYGLDLPADLVVLSACRTALGRRVRGDGIMGLTEGFLYAGASRLVVSLWDAEDAATAALMTRLYRRLLADGRPPASALRDAQLWLRRQPAWQAPVYWAGFVVEGDGFRPIDLSHLSQPTNRRAR